MKGMKKVVISGMVGNALEWYDYALYGHFAAIISMQFFPSDDPFNSMLATFGVFAAGFLTRPLGAVLFGYIGDRYGRKISLAVSILLMAIPTASIGLLPTYAQIGVAAPILLTVIRLLQGLSLGGEFSGSITYVTEHAPMRKRGIVGSSAMFSLVLGILVGSLVATVFAETLSTEDLTSWGWRVPFVIGLVIGLVGLYIRTQLHESPVYQEAKSAGHLSSRPLREAFGHHWQEMLLAVGFYMAVTVPFYMLAVFMNTFVTRVLGQPIEDALLMNTLNLLVMMVMVPFSGALSDKIGRKPVLIAVAIGYILLSYPIFHLLVQGGFLNALISQLLLAALVGWFIGPIPALLVELFPTSVRYTGMSVSYNFCAAAFGGTTPIVATWMVQVTGMKTVVAFYLMACAFISLIALYFYTDRHNAPLNIKKAPKVAKASSKSPGKRKAAR